MNKICDKYILTERDEELIRLLSQNSRQTYIGLAEQMGISRSAVAQKVERMEKAGVIKAYSLVVDWSKVVDLNDLQRALEAMG